MSHSKTGALAALSYVPAPSGPLTPRPRVGDFRSGHRSPSRWLPTAALVAVAVVWGVTFTVVDGTAASLPAPDLVLWRFGLASLLLGLVRRSSVSLPAQLWARSAVLGGLLGSGFLVQAWALSYTDALMSGFLTGLLVVVAPVAGWLVFRERLGTTTWVGVALAGAGVAVLGFRTSGFGPGELLTLASAAAWGLHLVLMSRWSQPEYAWGMARVQTGAVALLAVLVLVGRWVVIGRSPVPTLPADRATWASLLFMALVATAAAMVLLSWAQARVAATRAAVILTLEPAVSGLTAVITGSALTGRVVLGAALLVAAMAVVELARSPKAVSPRPDEPGGILRTGGWASEARARAGDQGRRPPHRDRASWC